MLSARRQDRVRGSRAGSVRAALSRDIEPRTTVRLCQGDDAACTCGNTQAARASLGAQAAGRTKRHRISKWRTKSISKWARKTAREQSRFCKEFSALSAGWGAGIRTWEWRNQNPPNSPLRSMIILKKSANCSPFPINGLGAGSECPANITMPTIAARFGAIMRMVRGYAQLDLKLKGVVEAIDEHLTGTKVSNSVSV
jgi:hypothetical protein